MALQMDLACFYSVLIWLSTETPARSQGSLSDIVKIPFHPNFLIED